MTDETATKRRTTKDVYERVGDIEIEMAEVRTDIKGVVRAVTNLSTKLDEATKPRDNRIVLWAIGIIAGAALTLTQCERQQAVDNAYERGRNHESFDTQKSQLAATKELLSQAIVDVEHRVTNGPMTAIREQVKTNTANLASRAGHRWNKPDQVEYEARTDKRFDRLEELVEKIRERISVNGWDRVKGEALTADVHNLERALRDHIAAEGHTAALVRIEDILRRLAAVEAKADSNGDEDFKRPEAEQMKAEIMQAVRELVGR